MTPRLNGQPVRIVPRVSASASNDSARWSVAHVAALFELPFAELLFRAQTVHREHIYPTEVGLATLLQRLGMKPCHTLTACGDTPCSAPC